MDKPLDAILPHIAAAVGEWQNANSEEKVKRNVKDLLDKNSKEITMKLLGFNTNYSQEWELDHCNGRSGESAAGDFIRRTQQTAIEEWLKSATLPVLDEKTKKRLHKEAVDEYSSVIRQRIREFAYKQATQDAADLIKTITVSDQIDNYLKAMKLIHEG